MILLRDAWRLSLTKLRIRIPRLVITIVIASILFALAVFIVSVVRGAVSSIENLNQEGLSNRYLVVGYPAYYENYFDNPELLATVQKAQLELQAKKKIEAKRLGVEYDPKLDPLWVESSPDGAKYLNMGIPEVAKIIDTYSKNNTNVSYETFEQKAKAAGAIATYRMTTEFPMSYGSTVGQLKVIKNGKETFKTQNSSMGSPYDQKGFASIESGPMRVSDESLLEPYVMPGQSLDIGASDGSIPAYVPFSVAEEALGLKALASNAKPAEKLERIQTVKSTVAGQLISVCYRNSTSSEQIETALAQQQEMERNKKTKGYEKPALIYGIPQTPCGPAVIVRDVRSVEQKKQDTKKLQFEELFGKETPQSRLQTVRVVGVLPDTADMYTSSVAGILTGVLSTSIGGGWIVPAKASTAPSAMGFTADLYNGDVQTVQYIAELPDAATQKQFIQEQSCDLSNEGSTTQPVNSGPGGIFMDASFGGDPTALCKEQDKHFMFIPFGNNAAAIDEFEKGFNKVFGITLIVLAVLSSLIMMGTIGRIIADSRRETAVFRAIGATRFDMTIVYGLYALLLATLVVLFALGLGWAAASIFSNHFGPQTTPTALLIFNVTDLQKEFVYVAFDRTKIIQISAIVYAAALLGLSLPLLTNLRRSPLKDMRDEN